MITNTQTKKVRIGPLIIGGGNPVRIQSMTNTKTYDVDATVEQIHRLEQAGCEIVRSSVPDMESAAALREIKKRISIPLVADIHFDYRLAIAAVENGADKIRINPGNIGDAGRVRLIVDACRSRGIPIRVGVNAGSLEKDLLEQYGGPTAEALAESALRGVRILEDANFGDIVVSMKASNLELCTRAYEMFAEKSGYPLHIGITEAGTVFDGAVKSAMGIGILLHQHLGDTLRVSLTGDPVEEVLAAKKIVTFAGLRQFGVEIISCPTCARTCLDLITLAQKAEIALAHIQKPLKVAIMGCAVNGPGEAREADLGIAGGRGEGLLFRKGEIVRKVPEERLLEALVAEADAMCRPRGGRWIDEGR